MVSASELRARARQQLGGNIFASKWLYVLLAGLIVSAIVSVSGFIPVAPLLLCGPLAVGMSAICLRQVRDNSQPVNIGECFYGFTGDRLSRSLVTGLLVSVFTALWSLLFVIPGIVKSYSYSMAFFISLDRPELSSTQCIDESRRMMNGNKMRLFLLDLSFIGWYIVGAFCFGIGTLWVDAYHSMARANFYDELCRSYAFVAPSANGTTEA